MKGKIFFCVPFWHGRISRLIIEEQKIGGTGKEEKYVSDFKRDENERRKEKISFWHDLVEFIKFTQHRACTQPKE